MFGSYLTQSLSVLIGHDPAADDDLPVFIAPKALEITGVKATVPNAVSASTANYFDVALFNGGTAGTALGVVAGTVGGTAGWTALTPVSFTVTNGVMSANQVLVLRYNEEGTSTLQGMLLSIDYRLGVA